MTSAVFDFASINRIMNCRTQREAAKVEEPVASVKVVNGNWANIAPNWPRASSTGEWLAIKDAYLKAAFQGYRHDKNQFQQQIPQCGINAVQGTMYNGVPQSGQYRNTMK